MSFPPSCTADQTTAATIVVPLRRQPDEWLERCVLSALQQSVAVEVVVVTSGDTPPSNRALLERMAKHHPSLRVLMRKRPGFAEGLNCGINAAVSERVGFLLADDWLHSTAVEKCLSEDADIVSTQVRNYAADGVTPLDIDRRITMDGYAQKPTDEARASYLSHFYLFKRAALVEAGGVDPAVGETGADDYDLIWTLLERGATVSIVEELLYFKRDHHGERLTLRDPKLQRIDIEKVLRKHGVHGALLKELVEDHARWFGRPIHEIVREDQSATGKGA